MKREQQQAQMQMAMQLLQMLREGRNQNERLQLARDQMQNDIMSGRRQARIGQKMKQQELSQAEKLANAELSQQMEIARMNQAAMLQQAQAKNEGLMNPQILDYIQKTMMMPPGAEREALIGNLETMTGKTFQRPVDQFQQYINPNK